MKVVREHDKREFFSRGQEEDPVRRARTRREREAHASTMNGNSSHPLCLSPFPPPPFFNFSGQTDRDEALISPQLQKCNRTGVKPYGLAHNKRMKHRDR